LGMRGSASVCFGIAPEAPGPRKTLLGGLQEGIERRVRCNHALVCPRGAHRKSASLGDTYRLLPEHQEAPAAHTYPLSMITKPDGNPPGEGVLWGAGGWAPTWNLSLPHSPKTSRKIILAFLLEVDTVRGWRDCGVGDRTGRDPFPAPLGSLSSPLPFGHSS
jgi:hypothetical protein